MFWNVLRRFVEISVCYKVELCGAKWGISLIIWFFLGEKWSVDPQKVIKKIFLFLKISSNSPLTSQKLFFRISHSPQSSKTPSILNNFPHQGIHHHSKYTNSYKPLDKCTHIYYNMYILNDMNIMFCGGVTNNASKSDSYIFTRKDEI